ncbi:hypothetical protein [Mucilaginibacter boryungensis]|nr:hypothetical protein [Mucilaginibacter boryungensis]
MAKQNKSKDRIMEVVEIKDDKLKINGTLESVIKAAFVKPKTPKK